MTNFQPDQASKGLSFITPERALLLLPVLAGIVLSGAVAGFALVPAANKLQELEKLEKENLKKRDDLPGLVRGKGRLLQQEARSKFQKEKLLQLVAGNRSLATLLSQLGAEAAKANVSLESYEPQTTAAKSAADPLLGDGIKKDQQLLVVQGSYPNLLSFLRKLEWLTPLLVISDLSLEGQKADPKAAATTTLKFTLTAYYKALVQP